MSKMADLIKEYRELGIEGQIDYVKLCIENRIDYDKLYLHEEGE